MPLKVYIVLYTSIDDDTIDRSKLFTIFELTLDQFALRFNNPSTVVRTPHKWREIFEILGMDFNPKNYFFAIQQKYIIFRKKITNCHLKI